MSSTIEPKNCPKCGALIPPEAPQGLCPKCLMAAASLATEAGQGTAAHSAAPSITELVKAFPQLEILELIGQGGMGFVFKARQRKLERLVALKILPASLAADPAFAERFTREGRLLAQLNHQNIVTIHDFGQANGYFYLLMEFVDGVNLRQAMRIGRFTPAQALAIVPKICEALQYAHNEGILHRDIKPENILLDAKGRVKIADFGIAKLMEDRGGAAGSVLPAGVSDPLSPTGGEGRGEGAAPALTATGKILGTPQYMAPEQIERPGQVDHRADIYSLGVVFYEMLTGELPLGRFAPPSEKSTADPRLDKVVFGTLEKEPERRTQTAGEVKTQVETITDRPADSARTSQPPSGVEPLAEEKRLAKRAIIAALLSGASLVFLVFGFILIVSTVHGGRQEKALIILLGFVGVPAVAGTVMGILALADFRQTPGAKRGFGFAVASAATWPVLVADIALCFLFANFFTKLFRRDDAEFMLILLFFCLPLILFYDGGIFWTVIRWGKRLPLVSLTRRARLWLEGSAVLWLLLLFMSLFIDNLMVARNRALNRLASMENPPPDLSSETPDNLQSGVAVIQTLAVPSENLSPGMSVWRWQISSTPARHVLSFQLVAWSNGVPAIIRELSSFVSTGTNGLLEANTFQLSMQDGAVLSADLAGQLRWLSSYYSTPGNGANFSPVWTLKDKPTPMTTLTSGIGAPVILHEGQTNSVMIQTRNLADSQRPNADYRGIEVQIILQPLPATEGWRFGNLFGTGVYGQSSSSSGDKPRLEQSDAASAELWAPPLAVGEKPNPQKILNQMQALTAVGRYEESLQMHVWYHNHALEYDPSQSGVRLSFALADWIELGRSYPKAKTALIEIRDRTAGSFDEGRGNFARFQEVASINSYLQNDEPTLELFDKVEKQDKNLAKQCYFQVRSLWFKRGMYGRYLDYLGDPQQAFESIHSRWVMTKHNAESMERTSNQSGSIPQLPGYPPDGSIPQPPGYPPDGSLPQPPGYPPDGSLPQPPGYPPDGSLPQPPGYSTNRLQSPPIAYGKIFDDLFVGETCQLIEALVGTGQKPLAEKIRDQAVAVLDNARLKSAVSDAVQKTLADSAPLISVPAARTEKQSGTLVIDTVPPQQMSKRQTDDPRLRDALFWNFKYLIPADHMAQVVFVLWSNGVPVLKPGYSGYFKVGPKPVVVESMAFSCEPNIFWPAGPTNVAEWDVCPGFGYTLGDYVTNQPPLRQLETAKRSVLNSGHQLAIRLAEFIKPPGSAGNGWSGVEIRLMLQPLSSPAVQTDPNELDRTNYVAGWGLAGMSEDSILKSFENK